MESEEWRVKSGEYLSGEWRAESGEWRGTVVSQCRKEYLQNNDQ